MDGVLAILEGTCPDCGSDQLAVTVTCHPNEAGNWSEGVTVVERADLAPGFIPSSVPWQKRAQMGWGETTLTLYEAKCQSCGASHYVEQSALNGDWRV